MKAELVYELNQLIKQNVSFEIIRGKKDRDIRKSKKDLVFIKGKINSEFWNRVGLKLKNIKGVEILIPRESGLRFHINVFYNTDDIIEKCIYIFKNELDR